MLPAYGWIDSGGQGPVYMGLPSHSASGSFQYWTVTFIFSFIIIKKYSFYISAFLKCEFYAFIITMFSESKFEMFMMNFP